MELIIGLLGGLLLSILFWWTLNHIVLPNIQFSTEISRSSVKFYKTGLRYQFAIRNCGKRNALNVRFEVSINIKEPPETGGYFRNIHTLTVGRNEVLCLKPNITSRKTIFVNESACFAKAIFPKKIRDKYLKGILTLDDVFEEFPNSYLHVQVIAQDSISSSTKYFSKKYRSNNIVNGTFPRKSITLVPDSKATHLTESKNQKEH